MSLSMLDPLLKRDAAPAFAGAERVLAEAGHGLELRRFRRHGLRPLVADCLLLATLTAEAEHEGALAQVLRLYESNNDELILEIELGRSGLAEAYHDCICSKDGSALIDWIAHFDPSAILPCELKLDAAPTDLHCAAVELKRTLEAMREQLQQLLSHYFPQHRQRAA
jgi:hypothetical protein